MFKLVAISINLRFIAIHWYTILQRRIPIIGSLSIWLCRQRHCMHCSRTNLKIAHAHVDKIRTQARTACTGTENSNANEIHCTEGFPKSGHNLSRKYLKVTGDSLHLETLRVTSNLYLHKGSSYEAEIKTKL